VTHVTPSWGKCPMVSESSEKPAVETSKPTDVAIIGAGMAGISAALALADGGHHAHLIERTVSIGGAYVAIYKIFPE
jgi:heterodisulfide reductase subunit A-like polyferredoxin